MGLEIYGNTELSQDITSMADTLSSSGQKGSQACRYILQKAAQPVLEQMIANASSNPRVISGKLRDSIKIGNVVKHRRGGYTISVGVHRSDGGAAYANPVEFGHGGPHPAPPHPFVRPAFDARSEEAYEKVKEELKTALDARGLL